MRSNGAVSSARGLLPFGHLGWGFRSREEFHARAAEYLADGVAQGQWVEFVGPGDRDDLLEELAGIPGGAEALERGCAGVSPVEGYLRISPDGVVDPHGSTEARVSAAERALRTGFAGFRAIVDATGAAATTHARAAMARFEHLIDRQMMTMPVSAMCGFDRAALGPGADELVCLHPFTGRRAPVRLFAESDGAIGLAGEFDLANRELFAATLARLQPTLPAKIVLEMGAVDFFEHTALAMLDRLARDRDTTVLLCNASPVTERMVRLLGLHRLDVEVREPVS